MKRKFATLVVVLIFALIFNCLNVVHANKVKDKRIWGKDRYETCDAIVKEGWKTCEKAVLVNGENFPDSLSACVLAKKYNAPILLSETNYLNKKAYENIIRLGVKEVFIIGGQEVITPKIEEDVKKLGVKVKRLGGEDRIKTSIEVAKYVGLDKGVTIINYEDFSSGISIASIAANLQTPIIMTPKDKLPLEVSGVIKDKSIEKTYIIGNENLVSKEIESNFKDVKRIGGQDKYDININILKNFSKEINFEKVYIAYSEEFADGLSSSALAALKNNPLILVGDEPYKVTMDFMKDKFKNIYSINILGGNAGIDEEVFKALVSREEIKHNVRGNTSGNIANYGYYAYQGNWIYYSNFDDNNKLYKMKKDGKGVKKLSDNCACFINVVGDWVYYVTKEGDKSYIIKSKTDGSSKYKILESHQSISFLNVYKDKILYLTQANENKDNCKYCLNQITVDGTFIGKIFDFDKDFTPWYLSMDGDYVYCILDILGSKGLYKIDMKNKNINKMADDALALNVSEGWIYYTNANGIYKIKNDGSKNQKISDDFPASLTSGQWGDPCCLNVEKNWIYYKSFKEQCLYKVSINGGEKVKLQECASDSVNLTQDYIYCHKYISGEDGFSKYIETVKIKK